jgi:type VI secretion system protein ImpL
MQKITKQAGKILLVVLFIIILAGVSFWIIVVKDMPWWFALAVDAGILALVLAFFAIRSYLMRRREKKFINRLIDQDNARVPIGQDALRYQILELQENWKSAVQRLRKSALRKKGNPLYVLPWYVIIGETGTGKTSAVQNSGLNTPMTEIGPIKGVGNTRNCDWYFFDNAIILDTAGRYTIPVSEASDLEEWKSFLVLLSRYRRKEPLNGLILAIAADRLLSADQEQLFKNATIIRQRLNHMMRAIGVKFPIYVLVTKMDLVFGFDDFSRNLEDGAIDEAMGYINNASKLNWHDVFKDAIQSVGNRLHQIRYHLLHETGTPSSLLLFPTEFQGLSEKLEQFLDTVLKNNAYQVTPMLRGIFFSSAIRTGRALSDFLTVTGLQSPDVAGDGLPKKGVYLKEFFFRILPADRRIYKPLAEFDIWKRITSSLALSSWLLMILLAGGLTGYSYISNLSVINHFGSIFDSAPEFYGDIQSDLVMLEKFKNEILELEKENRTMHVPRPIGFGKRGELELKAKRVYCELFEKKCVNTFDNDLMYKLNKPGNTISRQDKADVMGYLVLRILSLDSDPRSFKEKEFIPLASGVLQIVYPKVHHEFADSYGKLYYSYLLWNQNGTSSKMTLAAKRIKFETLQKLLISQLQDETNVNMTWLTMLRWMNEDNVRLSAFWGNFSGDKNADTVILNGAYTENGRRRIRNFLLNMREALDDNIPENRSETDIQLEKIDAMTSQFWEWYHNEFFRSWYNAIMAVENGNSLFSQPEEKRQKAIAMQMDNNPYLQALNISAKEINSYGNTGRRPVWVEPLLHAARIRDLSKAIEASKDQNFGGAMASTVIELQKKKGLLLGKSPGKAFEDTLMQAQTWTAYMNALKSIPVSSTTSKQMADAYAGCFSYSGDNGNRGQSPFQKVYETANSLQAILKIKPVQFDNHDPAGQIIYGPMQYLLHYAGDETAAYLQQAWTQTVVAPSSRTSPSKKAKLLFDENNGIVWKFVNGPAFPYLSDTAKGYQSRTDFLGNIVFFTQDFLQFLDNGAKVPQSMQEYYAVTLTTVPVRANNEAKLQPVSVLLDVSSTDKPFVLNNYNFPQKATLKWSPDTSGPTILSIVFPGFTLQKVYEGSFGFARFLDDFRYGKHVFTPDDFPDKKAQMESRSVKSVAVSYQIDGETPVLRLLNEMPSDVPSEIVEAPE